jgi:hypothetical protein
MRNGEPRLVWTSLTTNTFLYFVVMSYLITFAPERPWRGGKSTRCERARTDLCRGCPQYRHSYIHSSAGVVEWTLEDQLPVSLT